MPELGMMPMLPGDLTRPPPDAGFGDLPPSQDQTIATRTPVRHIPLAKCRVLYLGSAVPLETAVGLEAVQMPLRERYPWGTTDSDVPAIDAWLTLFSSGLLMQYIADKKTVAWFPIHSLHVCGAVKCDIQVNTATGERSPKFIALDSPEAEHSSHPPLFTCIMRRTKGVKVLECHSFICKSNKAAMALVQSCTHAYEHTECWTTERPPKDLCDTMESRIVPAKVNPKIEAPPEFFEKPPPQGYFYTSNQDLVKNYNVLGGSRYRAPHTPPNCRRPHPQLALPPAGAHVGVPPPMFVPTGPPIPGAMPFLAGLPPPLIPGPPPCTGLGGPPVALPLPPHAIMMPVPHSGYFADWDQYGERHLSIFPMVEDCWPEDHMPPHRQRRRSPSPRRRSTEREYRCRRGRSLSPPDKDNDNYYQRRPRTPPIDYDYDDDDDFGKDSADCVVYAPRYIGCAPNGHSANGLRDERVQDRRYPRADRAFGQTIREERQYMDDVGYMDAYKMNDRDSNLDYDMFRSNGRPFDELERNLGYFP